MLQGRATLRDREPHPPLSQRSRSLSGSRDLSRTRHQADTPSRIVQRSIQLFNRYGVQNVPIERIARDLGISPGNLTYHFKRKRDLLEATQAVLERHLQEALARPVQVHSAREACDYIIRVFRTLWNFRFFFNGISSLLTESSQLRSQYDVLLEGVLGTVTTNLVYLQQRGFMLTPREPNTFRLLAENLWAQWLSWLRVYHVKNARRMTPSNEALFDGAVHLWSMCQHSLAPAFGSELLEVFEVFEVFEHRLNGGKRLGQKRR